MLKFRKVKEIVEKIDSDKERLSVMPKNNEKNRHKYYESVEELENEYKEYEKEIIETLKERYEKETKKEENPEIKVLQGRLQTIEGVLYLLNDYKTSYEKMGVDKIIYKLGKFYKENLENVNMQILDVIKEFSKVGISLKAEAFDYSPYVGEYMETFIEEMHKGDINSNVIRNKFEEIYWKCSNIIIHIELNFRSLYIKNEALIDKYFTKERNDLLKKWQKEPKEIIKSYLELKIQKIDKEQKDRKILLNKFLNGELQTKDYLPINIESAYKKVVNNNFLTELNEAEIEENISKFLNSLYEYKSYMEFEFFIKDIKKYFAEKENYKKTYEQVKKNIQTNEAKLKKINKQMQKKSIFGKSKAENQKAAQDKLILQIKENYKELEKNKFYYQVYSKLNSHSSLFDVLELANSYYCYMIDCLIRHNNTITQEEMEEKIEKLDAFIKMPYNSLIKNITILEEKDIAMIIKDRYKLLNFNIEKDDLNENNIDTLIRTLEKIKTALNLKQEGLNIKHIEELCTIKKLLKNRN